MRGRRKDPAFSEGMGFARLKGKWKAWTPLAGNSGDGIHFHDIGIRVCMEKYGHCRGKEQEKEGPRRKSFLGVTENTVIDRVSWLVGSPYLFP